MLSTMNLPVRSSPLQKDTRKRRLSNLSQSQLLSYFLGFLDSLLFNGWSDTDGNDDTDLDDHDHCWKDGCSPGVVASHGL